MVIACAPSDPAIAAVRTHSLVEMAPIPT